MATHLQPALIATRLPGLSPLVPADWLCVDEDYPTQMAERTALIAADTGVIAALPEAKAAIEEACATVLGWIAADGRWQVSAHRVGRPDGVTIARDAGGLPLLGHLIQEDILIMAPAEPEYRLVAGVLCFPSRWRLDEKLGRPLTGIHRPVPFYDAEVAKRVNRVFAGVRVGAPLLRMNWLVHPTDRLHQPLGESERAPAFSTHGDYFLRTERQCLWRLPQTRAVLFSVKTTILPVGDLDADLRSAFHRALAAASPGEVAYRGGDAVWQGALRALQAPAA